MSKNRILIMVLTLAIGYVEYLNLREQNRSAQDRKMQWEYTAELHRNTGAPPSTLWSNP